MNTSKQTHCGVLPQLRTLEDQVADNPRESGRNGPGRHGEQCPGRTTGVQPVRGERGRHVNLPPSPAKLKTDAGRGVTRTYVMVLGRSGKPLMPCTVSRAKQFLKNGRARMHKLHLFAIRLVDRAEGETQPTVLKLDPGAKTTGVALNRQDTKDRTHQSVLHLAQVTHRGGEIRQKMEKRSNFTRRRRSANLRYRAPRFLNRTKQDGWLAPSIQSRIDNIFSLLQASLADA